MAGDVDAAKIRRVYGRGYMDGLKAASEGNEMNAEKAKQGESGLNGLGQKVYDCVPIEEKWTLAQVYHELKRRGSNADIAVVQGALNRLTDSGLIKAANEKWWKKAAKPRQEAETVQEPEQKKAEIVQLVQADKKDTLAELANIGRELRVAAERIIALSKAIDDAALAAEQRVAEAGKDADKLRQLQALLKGLA